MVILDTNIIIDHLRRSQKGDSLFLQIAKKVAREDLAISIITVQELYRGKSTLVKEEEEKMFKIISLLRIMPYTYEIAQLAGEITRDLDHLIEFADSAIAATTILNDAILYTLNKKDFINIKKLKITDN